MLKVVLKASESLIASSAAHLDILNTVEAFYNNRWGDLLLFISIFGGVLIAVFGFIVPFWSYMHSEARLKDLRDEVKAGKAEVVEKVKELDEKIAKAEKDLKEVKEWADKAKESEKKARASNFLNEAFKLYNDKKYKETVAKLDEAIMLDPEYVYAYNNRGLAKAKQKDYAGAMADYNEAIRLDPKYVNAYINRGNAKEEQGDYAGAIADYNEAIRLVPTNADAYINRGVAKAEQKDYAGAMADYNEAIKLDPKDAAAYNNRGLAKAKQKDYAGAMADYNEAIRLDPKGDGALFNKIIALLFLGEKEKAKDDLKVLKTLKHDDHTKDNLPVLELIVDGKFDDAGAMIADMKEKGIEVDDDFEKLLKLLNPPK